MKIYKLSSFNFNKIGGNEAGVVLHADSLTDEEMQRIALDIDYSETAFVLESDKADYKLRFFTPVVEVDLCGHATIAVFNLLRNLKVISLGDYTIETKAGILEISVDDDTVFMEQNPAEFFDKIEKKEIEACFNSFDKYYIGDLPIQIVSTGLKDILLQVKNNEVLNDLEPNIELIRKLTEKYDTEGIHVFSLEELYKGTINVRNFAPRVGINEESATGTANGALIYYLYENLTNTPKIFHIYQGYSMNKLSKVDIKVERTDSEITKVWIGGAARQKN